MTMTDFAMDADGGTHKVRTINGAEGADVAETLACKITHITCYNGQFKITPTEADSSDGDLWILIGPSTASQSGSGPIYLPHGFKTTTVGSNTKAVVAWTMVGASDRKAGVARGATPTR